jgi:hypothetical protein
MRWIVLLLSLTLLLTGSPAHSQSKKTTKPSLPAEATFKVRVRVFISMEDVNKAQFKQCLFRELRKIPEVTVVEDEKELNDFELHVVITDTGTASGYHTGFASALYVDTPLDTSVLDSIFHAAGQEKKDFAHMAFSGASFAEGLYVLVGPTAENLCKRIAAEFDTGAIEQARQWRQKATKQ